MRKRYQNAKNQLTAKRSVVQVNKRWPTFNKPHCTSPVTPPNNYSGDSKIIFEDMDALSQRVISLESNLCELARQFETQNRVNCCALQDLQNLKCSVKNLSDEYQDYKKSNEMEDEECETESEEEFDYEEEVKWLKERLLEMSESLKVQSECLKNIKCSEMPHLKSQLDENLENLTQSIDLLNQQHRQDVGSLNESIGNELKETKKNCDLLEHQISCIQFQMKDFEKRLSDNHELTCDDICSLRLEVTDKINKTLDTASKRSSHTSTITNLDEPSTSQNENLEWNLNITDSKDNISQAVCISITQRLCHIQKQVMSQSVCMQQLVRDLACKVDRSEFERYSRKIGDTIDSLLQLKHDLQAANNNAAGTCMPMSCISCQTTANMTITANVPKLPHLKYGRESMHSCNVCPQEEITCCNNNGDSQRKLSNSNWSCYSFKAGARKAGGSHTKVNRCMQVRSMRFRRLKSPTCASKRLKICKNEFKRNSNIF